MRRKQTNYSEAITVIADCRESVSNKHFWIGDKLVNFSTVSLPVK